MSTVITFTFYIVTIYISLSINLAEAAESKPKKKPQLTEVWEPVPKKVTARIGEVPSDAIPLLEKDLSAWQSAKGGEAKWLFENDELTIVAKQGAIRTKQSFCDAQYHVEWQAPANIKDKTGKVLEGQARGNSGLFIQGRYEVQILDSFSSKTYANGQASSIYKQHIPLVNATLDRNEWNVYDIIFTSPVFAQDGTLTKPAFITVLHNGVVVQNNVKILGSTTFIGAPKYKPHGCAPLLIQDHGNPVKFRNIWVREL